MKPLFLALFLSALAVGQQHQARTATTDAALQQNFEGGAKVAVLVGVGEYSDASGLVSLKYPKKDVEELAAELTKQGYVVKTLVDAAAPRGLLVRALKQVGVPANQKISTLLFYFSGHGFASKEGVNYLVPFGASVDELQREGLALTEVQDLIKATKAQRQIIWIDACRNIPSSLMKGVARRSFTQLNGAQGMRILLSTLPGSVSIEDDELQHGLFTYFLLRGIRGAAAGTDGFVTFDDLTQYVTTSLADYGKKHSINQTPFETGESSGDFLLAKPAATTFKASHASPAPTGNFSPGTARVNPADQLMYVFIPAGGFKMGCDTPTCFAWELNQRDVTMSHSFWLGQTEVKQSAYQHVMNTNPSSSKGTDKPAENMTWDEAQAYCSAIGGRLPTEAEWEYAARAGGRPQSYKPKWKYGDLTHDVGQPGNINGWNVYDMMGNVWEWAADFYAQKLPPGPVTDPSGPSEGNEHVTRGASFNTPEGFVRVGIRSKQRLVGKNFETGFRCVWP